MAKSIREAYLSGTTVTNKDELEGRRGLRLLSHDYYGVEEKRRKKGRVINESSKIKAKDSRKLDGQGFIEKMVIDPSKLGINLKNNFWEVKFWAADGFLATKRW